MGATTRRHEALILGCGPAGATAANLLARAGVDVLALDRAVFPRFHVGESLLPYEAPLLRRLGVSLDGAHQIKRGAEFLDERAGELAYFPFAEGLPGTGPSAHNVERALFDELLARRAGEAGAAIHFGEPVVDVSVGPDHVRITTDRAEYVGRYLIDATGQDALLARKARAREPITGLGRAAAFCHFHGLADDVRAELEERGSVKILLIDDGWMWLIPLTGGRVSVGVVKTQGRIDAGVLEAALRRSSLIERLTRGAQRTEPRLLGNFSNRNTQARGARYVCVGDAACFLDPIFSSGVSLAMQGAATAADLLAPALRDGAEADPELMAPLAAFLGRGYDSYTRLIRRFYHTRFVHNLFFGTGQIPILRSGLITALSGDVWREDNPFARILDRAQAR
ncbi:MAG: tryptophan 7-halogenase [Myxococcales bacterium]|nr:tryptophan 7-halogenase [Myxococcales bacterium]